ncbi:hypothetical protein [Streptomyces sp. IBSBF 2806]|uniref:hypothetical protein n=1 Tax=Streptomyces sp. IBSBF 2806 TaxID=2903529 RepID=UPI002FDBB85D
MALASSALPQLQDTTTARFLSDPNLLIYHPEGDGIRRVRPDDLPPLSSRRERHPRTAPDNDDLSAAMKVRRDVVEVDGTVSLPEALDGVAKDVLVLPRSERWHEAVSTALLGDWMDPLFSTGYLPDTALGALKAEACSVHRQLVPVWRRRTRHGRVLSLDADLGGLSLYDLVADDVGSLAHTIGGVFEDERLNRVLRGFDPAERAVVFAYAEGEGTTWTEAAARVGVADPKAFGERVRRKSKRLAAEQRRRVAQRQP